MGPSLEELRAQIDALDEDLLRLINQRAQLAQAIGHLKRGHAMYRPEREAQVLSRIRETNPGPLSSDAASTLFREIMSACLALEQPLKVTYLGPRGTFSEAAAAKHFGHAVEFVDCVSIDESVRRVESGECDYAIVPVENSTEGAIGRTLDLLVQTPLTICGEVYVRIEQHLLAREALSLEQLRASVERVYSHAQSLAQCQHWLDRQLPAARRVAVASNAEAARLAADEAGACAVAGEGAAQHYALSFIARNIEDEPNNTTRFFALGKQQAGPTGRDKTSFVMAARNRPGAIHALLTPLAQHAVSMTRLESRPSRAGQWEYLFFADIEGHQDDAPIARALDGVGALAAYLKILGSYPAASA